MFLHATRFRPITLARRSLCHTGLHKLDAIAATIKTAADKQANVVEVPNESVKEAAQQDQEELLSNAEALTKSLALESDEIVEVISYLPFSKPRTFLLTNYLIGLALFLD